MKRSPAIAASIAFACFVALSSRSGSAEAKPPAHVKTLLLYGINYVNYGIPVQFIAANADYAEVGDHQAELARAYKQAGHGRTVVYTDPTYISDCPAGGPVLACNGAWGIDRARRGVNYLKADDFIKGGSGEVACRPQSAGVAQCAVNPASTHARKAYRDFTRAVVAGERTQGLPGEPVDLFEADDSATTLQGASYGFPHPFAGMTDRAWTDAEASMLGSAVRPVLFNGVGYDWDPKYQDVFLMQPNVAGAFSEGCFTNPGGYVDARNVRWQHVSNAILDVLHHHKLDVCWMEGPPGADARPYRLYALASWWLTYEPATSVYEPLFPTTDQTADGHPINVWPEEWIVPTDPIASAHRAINELRSVSGAYVRKFRRCYQRGTPIGPCATFVNPSADEVKIDSRGYSKALVLDGRTSFRGGRARFSGAVPTVLTPISAAILAR